MGALGNTDKAPSIPKLPRLQSFKSKRKKIEQVFEFDKLQQCLRDLKLLEGTKYTINPHNFILELYGELPTGLVYMGTDASNRQADTRTIRTNSEESYSEIWTDEYDNVEGNY